jgi:hypothetical protein
MHSNQKHNLILWYDLQQAINELQQSINDHYRVMTQQAIKEVIGRNSRRFNAARWSTYHELIRTQLTWLLTNL